MRLTTVLGPFLCALLLVVPCAPAWAEQGQGPADANAHVDDLSLGTWWYGAQIDKRDLLGKVVLVEIWGS